MTTGTPQAGNTRQLLTEPLGAPIVCCAVVPTVEHLLARLAGAYLAELRTLTATLRPRHAGDPIARVGGTVEWGRAAEVGCDAPEDQAAAQAA